MSRDETKIEYGGKQLGDYSDQTVQIVNNILISHSIEHY